MNEPVAEHICQNSQHYHSLTILYYEYLTIRKLGIQLK